MNELKTCLVTGAAGFLGSHVAEHCLRAGLSVVGVDDLSGGIIEDFPESSNSMAFDLTFCHTGSCPFPGTRQDFRLPFRAI